MLNIEDLSPELKQKVIECKSPEELLRLAEAEGYNLTDEELASVSGGSTDWCGFFCGDNEYEYC